MVHVYKDVTCSYSLISMIVMPRNPKLYNEIIDARIARLTKIQEIVIVVVFSSLLSHYIY